MAELSPSGSIHTAHSKLMNCCQLYRHFNMSDLGTASNDIDPKSG